MKDGEITSNKEDIITGNGIKNLKMSMGTIRYFKKGIYHNENGPSIITRNGYKIYYINDKRYRIDGACYICPNGRHHWSDYNG